MGGDIASTLAAVSERATQQYGFTYDSNTGYYYDAKTNLYYDQVRFRKFSLFDINPSFPLT